MSEPPEVKWHVHTLPNKKDCQACIDRDLELRVAQEEIERRKRTQALEWGQDAPRLRARNTDLRTRAEKAEADLRTSEASNAALRGAAQHAIDWGDSPDEDYSVVMAELQAALSTGAGRAMLDVVEAAEARAQQADAGVYDDPATLTVLRDKVDALARVQEASIGDKGSK